MCVYYANTAYYYAEARECLVTAKRDFVFFLRHTHFVGGGLDKQLETCNCLFWEGGNTQHIFNR